MGKELVCSYLWSKFGSMLENAVADSDNPLIISRFRSIATRMESDSNLIPADHLYDLIEALSDFRVFTYQRRTTGKGIKLRNPVSELMFKRRMRNRLDAIEKKLLTPPRVQPIWSDEIERSLIRQTHPILDPSLIIGFYDEAGRIQAWLTASKEEEEVIGIVGRCGCGKTALAQKVFASHAVVEQFSPRVWVCLSTVLFENDATVLGTRIVNLILDAIDPWRKSNNSGPNYESLLQELQLRLTGKRYLIVLDNAWRFHEFLLPKLSGGAVIVTSRRENVIRSVVGDKHVIRLGPRISEDVCWRIFSTIVLQQGKMYVIHYSKLFQLIEPDVKRSFDGLPLIAKAFGNILPDLLIQKEPVAKMFPSSVIRTLLQKLQSDEIKTFANQGRVEMYFSKLMRDLSTILAVVNDADKNRSHLLDNPGELEDAMDEISTHVLVQQSKMTQQSRANVVRKLIPARRSFGVGARVSNHKTISGIKEITNLLQFMVNQKNEWGLMEHPVGPSPVQVLSTSSSSVYDSKVYGRDGDKESIIKMLRMDGEGDDSFAVIPIVGMGGIGKTTLAQMVYNDNYVKRNFDVRAWVYVSEKFDVISITRTLYELVTGEPGGFKDLYSVQVRLKKEFSKTKFLIVLDDVWNVANEKWDDLCRLIQVPYPGSRIILTTRIEKVAYLVSSRSKTYHMKRLSDDDCLSLMALLAGRPFHKFGWELMATCKGLPLAAKALGGVLRFKESTEEWLAVPKSNIWYRRGENILPVFKLSYHNLPSLLKQLFAYCSIFPKGYRFKKIELVHLWIGEGFLENFNDRETEEEYGLACFDELLSRSFFQRSSDIDECFVMHDLINDLAQFIAGSTCCHLIEEYEIPTRAHHVSFLRHDQTIFTKLKAFSRVRGLRTILPVPERNSIFLPRVDLSNEMLAELLQESHSLRVLSLSGYSITELPSSICNLILLSYLDLSGTSIVTLPGTLGNIYYLKSLSLRNCRSLRKLPRTIGKLSNLRRLDNSDTDRLKEMPVEIGELSNLRTLPKIVLSKAGGMGLRELRGLRHLRGSLSLMELQNVADIEDAKEASLFLYELDELQLMWGSNGIYQKRKRIDKEVMELLQPCEKLKTLKIASYRGLNFPSWIALPSYRELSSISILSCFRCKSLPPLGLLPELKHLLIRSMPNVERISAEFYGSDVDVPFPKLETLIFDDMPKWKKWAAFADGEKVSFPRLHQLNMSRCSKLIDVSPLKLPKLQELVLEQCSKLLVESFSNLHSLNSFKVVAIEGLSCLPEELIPSLSALEFLECRSCTELRSLCPNETPLEHLTNLRRIVIADCRSLVSLEPGNLSDLKNRIPGLDVVML